MDLMYRYIWVLETDMETHLNCPGSDVVPLAPIGRAYAFFNNSGALQPQAAGRSSVLEKVVILGSSCSLL